MKSLACGPKLVRLGLLLCLAALGCGGKGCASDQALKPAAKPPEPTITLRFRPLDRLDYREHWIYDLQVPGTGIMRNALSFDVSLLAKVDQDSFAVRELLRGQQILRDKVALPLPDLSGAFLVYQWGKDHALVAEISAEASHPVAAAALRSAAQVARFGTLIEYPDQAVAVGDSWSIEPRRLVVAPGLEATLRPSYTLQSIEERGTESVAVIASDVQVDVVPAPLGEGASIEGGGTASGSLRVRLRDGVLLEARTVMHFSQQTSLQGSEILGYREFSATAHVFTTKQDVQPNLNAEPYILENPEDDRECAALLAAAAQRFEAAPAHQHIYLASVERNAALPSGTGGATLRETGVSVLLSADGKRLELDGVPVETKDFARLLRTALAGEAPIIYLFADATTSLARVRALFGSLPRPVHLRLVVRDPQAKLPAPKTTHWQEERVRAALFAARQTERDKRLSDLLVAHLVLCEPALAAFQVALAAPAAWGSLRAELLRQLGTCGCSSSNLESLEATIYALFGSPDLRYVLVSKGVLAKSAESETVAELAKALSR